MTRLLRAKERVEAGFSLVEVMVAIAILMLVMGGVYTTINFYQAEAVTSTNSFTAISQGQLLVEVLGKDIRAAVALTPTSSPFTLADSNHMTFYSNLGNANGPTELNIYLTPTNGSNSIEGDATQADSGSAPNWTYGGQSEAQFTGKYVNTTGGPVLAYYDINGNSLATPVSSAKLTSIESVTITLTTQVTPTASPTTIATTIHIRNVDYNPQGS